MYLTTATKKTLCKSGIKMLPIKILYKPALYGYKECRSCDGHGSVLCGNRFYFCTECEGIGVLKDSVPEVSERSSEKNSSLGFRSEIN